MSGTVMGNGRYVPMDLYLDDRRQAAERLSRIEGKLDQLIVATAQDDGREVAEEASALAVKDARRSRGELLRDASLVIFAAVLAAIGTVITTAVT